MIIKRAGSASSSLVKALFTRRWLTATVGLVLLSLIILASIYYGMHLVKSGQSTTLRAWAAGLADAKLRVIPHYIDGLAAQPERLDINIGIKEYQKLLYKRQEALEAGILISKSTDWVPAEIVHRGETYKVDLRLKGDLQDHWRRIDRWSYKVKVKKGKTILGMKRFALQDPQTREYMNEWVIHRLQKELGLVGLRYEFVDVTVNGVHKSIYALEENFDKRLLESNDRREGPILKYDSWFYWVGHQGLAPELAGSAVSVYQENRAAGDTDLSRLHEVARSLLEQYRRGEARAAQVFDLQKMAAYFALVDLTGYYHATTVDNQKFYYNPVTGLIEPIGYDFNKLLPLPHRVRSLGEQILPTLDGQRDRMDWRSGLFLDEQFYLYYIEALEKISKERFLDEFFEHCGADYDDALAILHRSVPWYSFAGEAILRRNQKYLRRVINPQRSLQAYLERPIGQTSTITVGVQNIHALPAEIIALSIGGTEHPLPVATVVPGYSAENPIRFTVIDFVPGPEVPGSVEDSSNPKLIYRIQGSSNLREERIHPWPAVDHAVREPDIPRSPANAETFSWVTLDSAGKTITFAPGQWVLEESLIVPPGYLVRAGEGFQVDLRNRAMILSRSPLCWKGSEEQPIRIRSSDSTGQGVAVLSAQAPSELSWVEFDNLGNPSRHGWSLSGAVTFYESPVEIDNCYFVDSRCEDALNTMRGTFSIERAWFVRSRSDAFDADFCKGSMDSVSFIDCGNDAIDGSGSEITVHRLRVERAGDKGLSAGENSRLVVSLATIEDTDIAVACKDRSRIEMENVELRGNRLSFAAFQKKAEFGPGEILVHGLKVGDTEPAYLVEQGSLLIIDERIIPPNREGVKEDLYRDE